MSAVRIAIRVERAGIAQPRTHVYVDGRFCYQTGTHPTTHARELERLLEELYCDNVEVHVEGRQASEGGA